MTFGTNAVTQMAVCSYWWDVYPEEVMIGGRMSHEQMLATLNRTVVDAATFFARNHVARLRRAERRVRGGGRARKSHDHEPSFADGQHAIGAVGKGQT
jgi:hypothetical protein